MQVSVSYGVIEFRDIKRYCRSYYTNDDCDVNKKYEDNVSFYSRRYDDAEASCYQVMYDISNAGGQFYLYFGSLVPMEINGTSIKLASFKKYVADAGYDTSDLTTTEWNRCTMYNKKVNNDGTIVNITS